MRPVAVIVLLVAMSLAAAILGAPRQVLDDSANRSVQTTTVNPVAITPAGATETSAATLGSATAAAPSAGEQIKWQVLSGGGGSSASASYKLSATIGQTAAGPISSVSYKINQGFWQNFVVAGCCGSDGTPVRGNVNMLGIVNSLDLQYLIQYLTPPPGPTLACEPEANINAVGIINSLDLQFLIQYLTPPPGPALPACP